MIIYVGPPLDLPNTGIFLHHGITGKLTGEGWGGPWFRADGQDVSVPVAKQHLYSPRTDKTRYCPPPKKLANPQNIR